MQATVNTGMSLMGGGYIGSAREGILVQSGVDYIYKDYERRNSVEQLSNMTHAAEGLSGNPDALLAPGEKTLDGNARHRLQPGIGHFTSKLPSRQKQSAIIENTGFNSNLAAQA